MGPAPEDMIPQFITNWLGSYIDADSAPEMLMSWSSLRNIHESPVEAEVSVVSGLIETVRCLTLRIPQHLYQERLQPCQCWTHLV